MKRLLSLVASAAVMSLSSCSSIQTPEQQATSLKARGKNVIKLESKFWSAVNKAAKTFLPLLALCFFFAGCATHTTVRNNAGIKVLDTPANWTRIAFRSSDGTSLEGEGVNHSAPTLASGKATSNVIGAGVAGVTVSRVHSPPLMKIIRSFSSEGYQVTFYEEGDNGRVFSGKEADDKIVVAGCDLDIDADGSNGQNGKPAAYMVGNVGTEHLGNGGMKMSGGRVVFAESWAKDIVLHDGNAPIVFPGGIIASKTAYHIPGFDLDDPRAYLDSETVDYLVVQSDLIKGVANAVMGCRARATNLRNGRVVDCMIGDAGPRNKIGEGSISLARKLGLDPSPRTGGTEANIIAIEFWPGEHAIIGGQRMALQTSSGRHIL